MEVLEAFTQSKDPARPNEDAYVVLERHAAVIDGATDKSGKRYEWRGETASSGRFAALVVADALVALETTCRAPTSVEAMTFIGRRLDEAVLEQQPDIGVHQRPACSLVVYSAPRREVWSVGDCSWAFRGVQHRAGKKIDDITASLRAAVTEAHLADGWAVEELARQDPGREAIHGLLDHQGVFANRVHDLGYGSVNGLPVPEQYVVATALAGTGTLVLTSDGYPAILESREASDRNLFELVRDDPLCIGPLLGPKAASPGASVYDDRTWLSLHV
ncbi:hypothetical protein [Nocardioides ungokensis]|uniref:hypothetical protein n=1 Tax=Nocardioides ungokensis TaxID=1643322 RepID=UPI0015DD7BA7|nr:hypothetical protein [Nocardioides ungokensis]